VRFGCFQAVAGGKIWIPPIASKCVVDGRDLSGLVLRVRRDDGDLAYLQRDVGAMKGLYGNSLEEAWYGGYVCDGSKPSEVHFIKANLPPAKFFWSMTMYTIPDRFLYANPINQYSIGDRTKGLQYGKDGSLTIYVSNTSPGKEKESNWLPAPAAKCSLVARVYGPSKAAMTGAWKLPPLETEK
jgi:hypothetical protein